MGRAKPTTRLSAARRAEIELADAVGRALARLRPALPADSAADAVVWRVLAELNGALPRRLTDEVADVQPVVLRDGVEVVQEVQDLGHSVPLIAGKPTIVRMYLSYPPAPVTVRGEIEVARSAGGPWRAVSSLGVAQLDPARSGSGPAELASRRADLRYSLNFQLPAELTEPGALWVRMGTVLRDSGTALPTLAGIVADQVSFRAAAPFRLRLVRVRYRTGSPPVAHEPSATDVSHLASWLRRAYPIAELQLSTATVTAIARAPFDAARINAQLLALRAVDVSTGTDARTHYYGMVSDHGFFMRGLASGIPQTPQPGTVASGPTGAGRFGWDSDGSYGDWYGAHELGHTLGRFHAEFCGAGGGAPYPFPGGQLSGADEKFVGLDVGDPALGIPMRIMGGTRSHDVMSYCDNQWLSSFTYAGIHARLLAEDALGAGPPEDRRERMTSDMRLIAALNLTDRTGEVVSVLPAEADPAAGPVPVDAAAGVSVRFVDAAGEELDELRVEFRRSVCESPADEVTGVVDTVLAPPARAAAVQLLLHGEVVDTQPIGGATADVGPRIGLGSTDRGPGADGRLELRWPAPAEAPDQRYAVQVSEDGGVSWRTVGVGLREPAVTLSTGDYPGDRVEVRLLATTGTASAVLRTETVSLR